MYVYKWVTDCQTAATKEQETYKPQEKGTGSQTRHPDNHHSCLY